MKFQHTFSVLLFGLRTAGSFLSIHFRKVLKALYQSKSEVTGLSSWLIWQIAYKFMKTWKSPFYFYCLFNIIQFQKFDTGSCKNWHFSVLLTSNSSVETIQVGNISTINNTWIHLYMLIFFSVKKICKTSQFQGEYSFWYFLLAYLA